jgi:hypothetical protein
MFGYAAFAQPTFAGLGGASYYVNALETLNLADNENAFRTTFANVLEQITLITDAEIVIATFFTYITESLSVADASTVLTSFVSSINETITCNDSESALRTQFALQAENINLLETPLGFAWIRINDNQATQWVLIDNRQ